MPAVLKSEPLLPVRKNRFFQNASKPRLYKIVERFYSRFMEQAVWKLGIISDAHGNLPALKAIIQKLQHLGCDNILHAGDMLDLGPFSLECVEELFRLPNAILLKGNHEITYLNGVEHCRKKLTEAEKRIIGTCMPRWATNIGQKFPHCRCPSRWKNSVIGLRLCTMRCATDIFYPSNITRRRKNSTACFQASMPT